MIGVVAMAKFQAKGTAGGLQKRGVHRLGPGVLALATLACGSASGGGGDPEADTTDSSSTSGAETTNTDGTSGSSVTSSGSTTSGSSTTGAGVGGTTVDSTSSTDSSGTGGSAGNATAETSTSGNPQGTGVVTPTWSDYCLATFVEDHEIVDAFGDPIFTALAGEQYLISSYGRFFADEATLMYLTENGPYGFDVSVDLSAGVPFTSDCDLGNATEYYAVFIDVTVYAEEELTTPLCDLSAGTAVALDGQGYGYALTNLVGNGEPAVYSIQLSSLSTECGGMTSGYVPVQTTELLDTSTYLVPIRVILGP